MRTLIFIAVAFAIAFSSYAQVASEKGKENKAQQERISKLTPEERAIRRAQREMKHFGGYLIKPSSAVGRVAYIDTTRKIDLKWLSAELKEIESLLQINLVAMTSDTKITVANAEKELLRSKSEVSIFLVEDTTLPVMLVAPENNWAILNISALRNNKPNEAKFKDRLAKEIWRTFGVLCGAADSSMGCVLSPVNTIDELDAIPTKYISPDPLGKIRSHLQYVGVKPYYRTTYKAACREGWAPAPTNEYQKAIWDKVHTLPTAPITIKPETKKVER